MAKVIAIFNQKGGVGKTTTVINLGTALSRLGKKVLICDIDPQSNSTSGLGISTEDIDKNIYDILVGKVAPKEAIIKTKIENLHLLPATIDLAGADVELAALENRNSQLAQVLDQLKDFYNYIIIDCPPSLSILTLNALVASESVIIPIQCEYYSLEGIAQLLNTIQLVKQNENPKIKIEGILLTMADKRTNLTNQVIDNVKTYFQDLVYDTIIPRNIRLAEAPSFGQSIFKYSPSSTGAIAYQELADEFIRKQE